MKQCDNILKILEHSFYNEIYSFGTKNRWENNRFRQKFDERSRGNDREAGTPLPAEPPGFTVAVY